MDTYDLAEPATDLRASKFLAYLDLGIHEN